VLGDLALVRVDQHREGEVLAAVAFLLPFSLFEWDRGRHSYGSLHRWLQVCFGLPWFYLMVPSVAGLFFDQQL
jgi:hypothetical protein